MATAEEATAFASQRQSSPYAERVRTFLYINEAIDFSDSQLSPDELARYVAEHEQALHAERLREKDRRKRAHCGFVGGFI